MRQVKGKGQFDVISLCPQVSFGRRGRLAGWSALLKQVSLDFKDWQREDGDSNERLPSVRWGSVHPETLLSPP